MEIDDQLQRCIHAAKLAGCPQDQTERFITSGYIPFKWQWQFHAMARLADEQDGPVDIGAGGARGPGKALSLDMRIPTPTGFTTMGKIKIGDEIYALDGSVTKVIGVSGVQKGRKCYDVIFSDGSSVTADAEHLWSTFTKQDRVAFVKRSEEYRAKRRIQRGKKHSPVLIGLNTKEKPLSKTRTTEDIRSSLYFKNEINHSIDVSSPIIGSNNGLPIDPYMLGVWLGDGHKDGGKISCFDDEIIDEIRSRGYSAYRLKAEGLWRIEELTATLNRRGLLHNKHIPDEYLRASIEQRTALLQGLNDTDGYVDKDGAVEFTNTNKKLSQQYYELVCSLGVKATSKESDATLYGRIISRKWRIRYTTSLQAFQLKRKKEKQKINGTNITKRRFIVEVRERDTVPVQCITVDHPSHCFLVTDSFIPTHNSHSVLSQVALDDCQRVEGLKCLFLRQTGTSAKESFDDLVDKVVRGHVQYTKTLNLLRFPNGSRILLGGFHDQRDIDKYIGIEYDVIIVEELNQLTEDKYQKLRGSLRTSKNDWRPRMYTSFNPGGIGHNFVKERYVIPFREKREKDTRFIPSTYKLNPALHTGYIEYLESLEGDLGKAWREGEWDLFAGQYFSEWRFEKHVVTPFTIPPSWFRFRSIDPSGRSGTTSCHWYAVDQNGTAFVYKEYYETGKDYDEHAKAIYKKSLDVDGVEEEYRYTVIDTAAFARAGYSETAVEIYERNGVTGLIEAAKERVIGWNAVHQYLRWDADTEPKLKIFSTCPALIKEIPLAQHDEDGKNPEDVKSQYIGATHLDALDDCRYMLRTLRDLKAPKELSPVERKLRENMRSEQEFSYNYSR